MGEEAQFYADMEVHFQHMLSAQKYVKKSITGV